MVLFYTSLVLFSLVNGINLPSNLSNGKLGAFLEENNYIKRYPLHSCMDKSYIYISSKTDYQIQIYIFKCNLKKKKKL